MAVCAALAPLRRVNRYTIAVKPGALLSLPSSQHLTMTCYAGHWGYITTGRWSVTLKSDYVTHNGSRTHRAFGFVCGLAPPDYTLRTVTGQAPSHVSRHTHANKGFLKTFDDVRAGLTRDTDRGNTETKYETRGNSPSLHGVLSRCAHAGGGRRTSRHPAAEHAADVWVCSSE
eukprot:scaffold10210_cov53-Phaeocystis_antarctica.AAC.5